MLLPPFSYKHLKSLVKHKLIPILTFLLIASTMAFPAAAETADISGSIGDVKTQAIDIYVPKAISFSVRLPVSITLGQSNGTGTASYNISVKGDVGNGSSVIVEPQATSITFNKTKGNTATLIGSITQAETTVAAADITTTYPAAGQLNGSVSVSGLTAGMWKGQITFLISYMAPSSGGTELHATALTDICAMQATATAPLRRSFHPSVFYCSDLLHAA